MEEKAGDKTKMTEQKTINTVRKKKTRISILIYVGLLFMVSVFIVLFCLYFMSSDYRFEHAAKESGEAARDACLMAEIVLKYEDPHLTLMSDENKRNEVHALFSSICAFSNLKYLYLYTVDEQEVRHRLVVAASEFKDDRFINDKAGFGTTSNVPLYKEEREALKGDVEGGFEIINNEYGEVCAWFMPVLDGNDNVIALIGADYSMDHILGVEKRALRRSTVIILIVFAATFLVAILMIRLMILKPLHIISERMKNFMQDRNCELPKHWMPFEGSLENEVSDIADSFMNMGKDLNQYLMEIEELTRKEVANEVQEEVASNIQYGMVPPHYTEENEAVSLEGFMQAAKAVGGDFYDCFPMEDGKYCVFIGDVSDKGVSAALFMAMARTMLKDHMNLGVSPAEAINRTNDELCAHNPEGMFVTMFAYVLDTKTGEVVYANAGHNPPLIIGKDGPEYLKPEAGMVTGLVEGINIRDHSFTLEKGQTLIVYTDGIVDAVGKNGKGFGEDRLKALFEAQEDTDENTGAVQKIVSAVEKYSEGCDQFDDMTILTLKYK